MGREKQGFNTRSPDSPMQLPHGAQFRFLRIDLVAEISRQLVCGLGEEKLASREVKYARARGGNNLRTGKLSRASLANANPRPAGTFRHSGLRPDFLSLPFSIESGGFGLVKAG